MAWLPSHQSIGHHPKTRKLARHLKISLPATIGHLHLLWWWALDYAPNGNLSRYESADIAEACMFDGDPETFFTALHEAGFLDLSSDDEWIIHDWGEYGGKYVEQKNQDAERKRQNRNKKKLQTQAVPPPSNSFPVDSLSVSPGRPLDVQTLSSGAPKDEPRMSDVERVERVERVEKNREDNINACSSNAHEHAIESLDFPGYEQHKQNYIAASQSIWHYAPNSAQAHKVAKLACLGHMERELISLGVERAAEAGRTEFNYLMGIYNSWVKKRIKTAEEAAIEKETKLKMREENYHVVNAHGSRVPKNSGANRIGEGGKNGLSKYAVGSWHPPT